MPASVPVFGLAGDAHVLDPVVSPIWMGERGVGKDKARDARDRCQEKYSQIAHASLSAALRTGLRLERAIGPCERGRPRDLCGFMLAAMAEDCA